MTNTDIVLGSWVVHPEHGLAQVWHAWVADPDNPEVSAEDDGVVVIATGKELFTVRRQVLQLADMGGVP